MKLFAFDAEELLHRILGSLCEQEGPVHSHLFFHQFLEERPCLGRSSKNGNADGGQVAAE
jgi:hypothetical protein